MEVWGVISPQKGTFQLSRSFQITKIASCSNSDYLSHIDIFVNLNAQNYMTDVHAFHSNPSLICLVKVTASLRAMHKVETMAKPLFKQYK